MTQMKRGAKGRAADVPRPRRERLSEKELDARLHDAAVELRAADLPSLARGVDEARRRLGTWPAGRVAIRQHGGRS